MKRKIELKNVKGTYDYLPNEQRIRNFINETLKEIFEKYGYQPLETPIICYYDLLAGKYDESNDLLNEIYKLTDQGKRKLGLRYDLTVPFAKCITITKDLRLPFKRYEIGKVFRDGPVKTGRDREFIQCDVDVVGIQGQMIEAELISLFIEGYNKLGIDVIVKYNSRNLMSGLIIEQGISSDLVSNVITIIDKLDKIKEEELLKEFNNLNINNEKANNLLNIFKLDLNQLNEKYQNTNNELIKKGLSELNELESYIKEYKDNIKFVATLARGQEYYTGNVFEVYSKNNELSCSLGGGGRYDNMITDFIGDGNKYPAVGISFGLSTIYEILKNKEQFKNRSLIDIYIIPMNTKKESLFLANKLRNLGYKVDIEMNDKKLKKSFEYANRENIPYVIVLGEDEIKNNYFNIKNMETGVQIKVEDIKTLELF
ncbi:MAG TPA: histidine--tRNA ligase [Candidatus Faecisoma merdavium]|nr:histidine--tRNA ligase [Candidatus Faecisoma merdavium]